MTHDLLAFIALSWLLGFTALVSAAYAYRAGVRNERDRITTAQTRRRLRAEGITDLTTRRTKDAQPRRPA